MGGIEETYGFYLLAGKYYPHFGEYVHGEYEDNATTVDRDQDIFTMQLAIEF